jgi:hypothetical protein
VFAHQIEIYFSILQRKALTPRHFHSLRELDQRIMAFQADWQAAAKPIDWRYTRRDLNELLDRLSQRDQLTCAASAHFRERPLASGTTTNGSIATAVRASMGSASGKTAAVMMPPPTAQADSSSAISAAECAAGPARPSDSSTGARIDERAVGLLDMTRFFLPLVAVTDRPAGTRAAYGRAGAGSGSGPAWVISGRTSDRRRLPQTSAPTAKMAAAHQNAVVYPSTAACCSTSGPGTRRDR